MLISETDIMGYILIKAILKTPHILGDMKNEEKNGLGNCKVKENMLQF